jgi:hypothetical protein
MTSRRPFPVTVRVVQEHTATVVVRARSQAEADRLALASYWSEDFGDSGIFPAGWDEHEPIEHDAALIATKMCATANITW